MKKSIKLFFILIISLVFSKLYASKVDLFTPGLLTTTLTQNIQYDFTSQDENSTASFSTELKFDADEILLKTGMSSNTQDFNLTSEFIYWPKFFSFINFGVESKYHLYISQDEFWENDFIGGVALKMQIKSFLNIYADCGYLYKLTVIQNTSSTVYVKDFSIDCGIGLTFYPSSNYGILVGVYSSDYYDYPLFLSYFFKVGFTYFASPKLELSIEYDTKWLDFYCICPYPAKNGFKLTGSYRL